MKKNRGFHWFVAMRYLRGAQYTRGSKLSKVTRAQQAWRAFVARHGALRWLFGSSRVLLILTGVCAASLITCLIWRYGVLEEPKPFHPLDPWLQRTELGAIISGALTVIVGSLGVLRSVFSFNSTVSIFGVWIGTMALVFVLSVMSGFESDLRQKILGSNAHIQITKVEGEFVEWAAVRDKIAKVPGVMASTPFATTEVVIAANNNYFNVIVKGIDPETVGPVTHLIDDIQCNDSDCSPAEAREVMARLDPLVDDDFDRDVPQAPEPGPDPGKVIDQMPPDMVHGTDPIDFSGGGGSGGGSGNGSGSASKNGSGSGKGGATGTTDEAPSDFGGGDDDDDDDATADDAPTDFGGDAPTVLGMDAAPAHPPQPRIATDPAPDDLLVPDQQLDPQDLSGDGDDHSISDEYEPPSKRAKMLDGVLVGRELTKQIHLYTDQEVKLVSPLTDPANPDANGTPIPYNADYRIAGQFFTGMYEYDLKFVYMTLDAFQKFLDKGDAIEGLEVRIEDPDDTSSILAAIQRSIGKDYKVQDWQELNRSLFSALKLEKIAMFLVLAIIILVASFSIVGNLVMVVVEKGKEIALLKTLGASDRGVTWIFITQGFFIGVIGTGIGVAYGLLGCFLAKRFGIPINPDVYYIDKLPIHVDLNSVALIACAGLIISVGATVYPAMVAARLAPSVGLRH